MLVRRLKSSIKIRNVPVLISCVLFTIALLSLVPLSLRYVIDSGYQTPAEHTDVWRIEAHFMWRLFGTASLTIISIGLVVTWTGYLERVRWAWFVMFALVWGWAYPTLDMRVLVFNLSWKWIGDLFYGALHDPNPHLPRVLLGELLVFGLMLIALILPIRAFLNGGARAEVLPAH